MKNKFGKNDIIVLASLLAAGLLAALFVMLFIPKGSKAQVYVDGEKKMSLELDTDQTLEIAGYDGGANYIEVREGKVSVTEASCPDKLCVHMGVISKNGQSIICLPNRVEIRIESTQDDEYDGVAR